MSSAAALRISLIVALAAGCLASPLPPGGAFAYKGQPAFVTGFWAFNNSTSLPMSSTSRALLQNVDGNVVQDYTAFGPAPGSSSPRLLMRTTVARALSFECVDDRTYRVIYIKSEFRLEQGAANVTQGFPPATVCGIYRVDGSLLRIAEVPITGNKCPDVSDLPTGDEPGDFYRVTAGGAILARVNTSVTPPVAVCLNQSVSTTDWFKLPPLESVGNTLASAGPPCATFKNSVVPAGPANSQAIWFSPLGPAIMTDSRLGVGSISWNPEDPIPSSAGVSLALYGSSECLGPDTSRAASFVTFRFLNGTVQNFWGCGTRARAGNTLNVSYTAPYNLSFSLSKMAPLPDNPDTTCHGESPSPSPTPSPLPPPEVTCTYRGTWRVAPLHNPCRHKSLAYVRSSCANTSVALRSGKSVYPQRGRLVWGLNHDYKALTGADINGSSTASIVAFKGNCAATNLAGAASDSPTAPQLFLQTAAYGFKVLPLGRGAPDNVDCTSVYIVSTERAKKGLNPYLTVPNTCDAFAWAPAPGGRSQFRLIKESEVLPEL